MGWKLILRRAPAGFAVPAGGLLLASGLLTGCSLNVHKGQGSDDKDVSIRTPMGGLHVQKNATKAEDIGLPGYPGATLVSDADGGNSADVSLGFGEWQLRVRAAKYQSVDPETKVESFYRQALARYGSVIECRNGAPMGTPATTREGLACNDHGAHSKGFHLSTDEGDHDLRAGSKRHQHIVAFKTGTGATQFSLVELSLPADSENKDKQE